MTNGLKRLRDDLASKKDALLYNIPIGKLWGNEILRELTSLDDVTAIAVSPGNALADEYMRGMANGLILAQSIMNGSEPEYIEAPESKISPELQTAVNKAMGVRD